MTIKQKSRRLAKLLICVLLMPVTIILASELDLANNMNVKATEVDSAETTTVVNKSLYTSLAIEPLSWVLTADQWEIARNGESILSLAVLNDLVNTWLFEVKNIGKNTPPRKNEIKNQIIDIQYPGGEEGEFWVQELVDWLVALGVPSRFMSVTPGSAADEITFHLNRR